MSHSAPPVPPPDRSPGLIGLRAAALFALPAWLCSAALGRGFVSEDFLLLRLLDERGVTLAAEALTGPWLGIALVEFYRPVSTLLLAVEAALFGLEPLAFALAHLAIHGLNALLLARLVERLAPATRALPAFAAALLFALYPLQLNAWLFVASFATLFAAAFSLAFLVVFAGWRSRLAGAPRRRRLALAALLLLLALGSYEGAAVLPALALVADLALPPACPSGAPRARALERLVPHLLFFALLGAYLLLRARLLSGVLGGYESTRGRLSALTDGLFADLPAALAHLWMPLYGAAAPRLPAALVLALLALLVAGGLACRSGRLGGEAARPWGGLLLLGIGWALVAQAPFGFALVVPGNGRYWYFAAAGAALAVVAAAGVVALALRRRPLPAVLAITGLLALVWGSSLHSLAGRYAEAGALAAALPRALAEHGVRADERVFVTRYPVFVTGDDGTPLAQVFRWGLRDAFAPPFVRPGYDVLPLPALAGGGLLPVAQSAYADRVFSWHAERRELVAFARSPRLLAATAGVGKIEVLAPRDGARLAPAAEPWSVVLGGPIEGRATLFVVTAAHSARIALPPAPASATVRAELPADLLRAAEILYPGVGAYWWVEMRAADGALAAQSEMRRLEVAAPASAAR